MNTTLASIFSEGLAGEERCSSSWFVYFLFFWVGLGGEVVD